MVIFYVAYLAKNTSFRSKYIITKFLNEIKRQNLTLQLYIRYFVKFLKQKYSKCENMKLSLFYFKNVCFELV